MTSQKTTASLRNTGLDILRILAMLGIVTLHTLGHGNLLDDFGKYKLNGSLLWLFESIAYFSVNVFVLISGYFLCEGKFKFNKFLKLTAEITFWSVVAFGVYTIATHNVSVTVANKSLFSSYFGVYWFATVYLGLYLLSPFLNILVKNMTKHQFVCLLVVMTVLSCLPFLNVALKIASMILYWFITLYFYGAFFRTYEIKLNSAVCILMLVLSVAVLWLSKVFDISLTNFISGFVWEYHSLITLLGSVAIFLLFANIKSNETKFTRVISTVSMGTFGVYLIHDNSYTRDLLWSTVRKIFVFENTAMLVPKVLISILIVFIVCWILDCLRRLVFRALHINLLLDKLSMKLELVWAKMLKSDS